MKSPLRSRSIAGRPLPSTKARWRPSPVTSKSGVGAASGQLFGERRSATGLAAGLLIVGLLVRMVADGIDWLGWASWLTPFGLLSLSAPYAGDRWLPWAGRLFSDSGH